MSRVEESPVSCANCREPMDGRTFESRDGRALRVDICYPCHAIWFDQWESVQLAPGGIIELFRAIHEHQDNARRSIGNSLNCPRCATSLVLTQDLCRTGRFSYYRCKSNHGRFTPFFQFLREKQFVRTLTPAELVKVRAQVKEVRCSGCGAAVDLEKANKCDYCEAPIAVLDADAVEKAMRFWADASAKSGNYNSEALAQIFKDIDRISQTKNLRDGIQIGTANRAGVAYDLLDIGINIVGTIFRID